MTCMRVCVCVCVCVCVVSKALRIVLVDLNAAAMYMRTQCFGFSGVVRVTNLNFWSVFCVCYGVRVLIV